MARSGFSGLAVTDAEIKATQTATGLVRPSPAGGRKLRPVQSAVGPYQLEVSKEGFAKYVQGGIVLQVAGSPPSISH
jgi:hypothetical protein